MDGTGQSNNTDLLRLRYVMQLSIAPSHRFVTPSGAGSGGLEKNAKVLANSTRYVQRRWEALGTWLDGWSQQPLALASALGMFWAELTHLICPSSHLWGLAKARAPPCQHPVCLQCQSWPAHLFSIRFALSALSSQLASCCPANPPSRDYLRAMGDQGPSAASPTPCSNT